MISIILLNGPPGSGKDTVSNLLKDWYPNMRQEKFANPIRAAIRAFHGWTDDQLEHYKRMDGTTREEMMWFSEKVVKPIHGPGYFATACVERIERELDTAEFWCISDCGFQYELDEFCTQIRQVDPEAGLTLIRLSRPFCIYLGDTREPVYLDPELGRSFELRNEGSIAGLAGRLKLNLGW